MVSTGRSAGAARYFPQWDGIDGSDGWARGMDGERQRRLFLRYGNEDWRVHLLHGRRQKDAAGSLYAADFDAPVTNIDAIAQIGLRFRRTHSEPLWIVSNRPDCFPCRH